MCANTKARGQMLEKLPEDSEGKKNFLPPQVFNGDEHCGDYESFFDARECDLIYSFFKLNPPEGSSVSRRMKTGMKLKKLKKKDNLKNIYLHGILFEWVI